jgi:homocysteine S-methyltransferase
MLHDGSEYTGNYGVSSEELRAFHAPRIRLFDGSDVDVIALETVPSLQEAAVLSELLEACTTPSWVSFSCRDRQRICDGSPLAEAVKLFASHPSVVAIGVNCTPPQYVPALLRIIRDTASDKFALAYPNSGEAYNAADNSWSGTVTPGDCADAARAWIEAGAAAVGGCCRMGPEHINAMAAMITALHS